MPMQPQTYITASEIGAMATALKLVEDTGRIPTNIRQTDPHGIFTFEVLAYRNDESGDHYSETLTVDLHSGEESVTLISSTWIYKRDVA